MSKYLILLLCVVLLAACGENAPSPDSSPNTPDPTETPADPDPNEPEPADPDPNDPNQPQPDGPLPPNEGSEFLANITFMGSSRYETSGSANVVREGSDLRLELNDDFKTSSGPDLYLWLIKDENADVDDPRNYLEIAPLTTFSGAQSFDINLADIDDYEALYIWCEDFGVLFGSGVLEKP